MCQQQPCISVNVYSWQCKACHNNKFCNVLVWSPWQDGATLQKDVLGFNPVSEGLRVKNLNILLWGGVGAGKSSTISTVDSLCQGRISRIAPHGEATGSFTSNLNKYKFTNPDTKGPVRWQLWDSMGWGASDYKKGELGYILDGHLPDSCRLDQGISIKTAGYKTAPSIEDQVHCVCMVVPCDAATDESYMERLREMREFARLRSEYFFIVFHPLHDMMVLCVPHGGLSNHCCSKEHKQAACSAQSS